MKSVITILFILFSSMIFSQANWIVGEKNPNLINCPLGYASMVSGPPGANASIVPRGLNDTINLNNEVPGDYIFDWCCPHVACVGCKDACVPFTLTVVEFVCDLTATVQNITSICENEGPFTIEAFPSGGTAPFTYEWDNGSTVNPTPIIEQTTTSDLFGLVYEVTVTDANGCTAIGSDQFNLLCPANGEILSFENPTCGNCDGSITVGFNGHTTRTSIEFSINGGSTYPYNYGDETSPQIISNLCAGNYDMWVRWGNNACPVDLPDVELIEGECCDLVLEVTDQLNNICGSNDLGLIQVTATNGVSPYLFDWGTTQTFTNNNVDEIVDLDNGSYCLTVTDGNNCTAEICTDIINEGDGPMVSIIGDDSFCEGGSVDLTATPAGLSYEWSSGETTDIITVSTGSTYTVTVTDADGCTGTNSQSVIQTPNPIINCSGIDGDCTNPAQVTTTTNGVSPFSYSWSNGATTSSISGVQTGTYTVTVTDANGCTSSCSDSVVFDQEIPNCFLVGTGITCNDPIGSIDAQVSNGNPPYSYNWSNGATTEDIGGLTQADLYILTVTDANGCSNVCVYNMTNTIVELNINLQTTGSGINYCEGGSVSVTAVATNGANEVAWDWSNGVTTQTQTFSGQAAGNYAYSVTITDANGCTGDGSLTVFVYETPTCNVDHVDTTCGEENGSATVSVSGGSSPYTTNWSNGGSGSSISNLSAGTYTATVTDNNGCQAICSTVVDSSTPIDCEILLVIQPSCVGGDGVIQVIGSNGMIPYTYLWSDGQTNNSAVGLSGGTYTVTVTDAEGCTAICGPIVFEDLDCDLVSADITTNSDGECFAEIFHVGNDCSSYEIEVLVDGLQVCAPQPIPSNGFVGCELTGLTGAVTYNMIHDSDPNCSLFNEEVGDVDCGCECEVSIIEFSSCGLESIPSGCSGSVTYNWSDGSNSATISSAEHDVNYCVTVTDGNGCTAEDCFLFESCTNPEINEIDFGPLNVNYAYQATAIILYDCNGGGLTYSASFPTPFINVGGAPNEGIMFQNPNNCSLGGNDPISDAISALNGGISSNYPNCNATISYSNGILELFGNDCGCFDRLRITNFREYDSSCVAGASLQFNQYSGDGCDCP